MQENDPLMKYNDLFIKQIISGRKIKTPEEYEKFAKFCDDNHLENVAYGTDADPLEKAIVQILIEAGIEYIAGA